MRRYVTVGLAGGRVGFDVLENNVLKVLELLRPKDKAMGEDLVSVLELTATKPSDASDCDGIFIRPRDICFIIVGPPPPQQQIVGPQGPQLIARPPGA